MFGLLNRLDRNLFEPLVCVSSPGGREREVRDLDVELLCLPHTTPALPRRRFPGRVLAVSRPFRGLNLDLWHSWNYSDDYSEPLIARASGCRRWIFTKKNLSWGSRAWVLRSLFASHIVTSNDLMRQMFYSGRFWAKRTSVVTHGVDTELFCPRPGSRDWLRRWIGAPLDSQIVGCVANMVPLKDHGLLIRAVGRLDTPSHLLLVGSGDEGYVEELRELVASLGLQERVHFVGALEASEVARVLAGLDVFVLPSRSEGLGVAVIEAMACEVASVATRCVGPEVIIDSGENGRLVPVGDEMALASTLEDLISDQELRKRLGQNGRKTVLSRFGAQMEADSYSQLYQRLASGRQPGG